MNPSRRVVQFIVLMLVVPASFTAAQTSSVASPAAHDGTRDFDWEIGTWKTHLKQRLRPLSGTNEWVEYELTDAACRRELASRQTP